MNKKRVFGVFLALCTVLFSGCGEKLHLELSAVEEDSAYVSADGKIELVNVESFDREYYSEKELKDFIQGTVDTYQGTGGRGAVSMEDFSVEHQTAKVMLVFDSAETYTEFQGEMFKFITWENLGDNLVLPEQLISAGDGSKVDKQQVMATEGLKYVIVNEALNIHVDGIVEYYSDASMIGENVVQTNGVNPAVIVFR